jgi:hypothetical protein
MMDMERRHLAQADRHIAECKAHVARQERMVEQLATRGHPTEVAQVMLEALQASLRAFEAHRKLIVSAIDAEKGRGWRTGK